MIICICGVSGSGKTTLWSTHPMLRQCGIPRADIANIYREFESSGRPINAQQALQYLLQDVRTFFREHQHPQAAVAVEAFFEPRGWQRRQIQQLAAELHQDIVFIWCHAPRQVCYNRVLRNATDSQQCRDARLRFVQAVHDSCFRPVPGKDAQQVLSRLGDCSSCRRLKVLGDCQTCSRRVDRCAACLRDHMHPSRCSGCSPMPHATDWLQHSYASNSSCQVVCDTARVVERVRQEPPVLICGTCMVVHD